MKNEYTKEHDKKDIKERGEVFTPEWLVEEMLSKLPQDILLNTDKTLLDNSCGNGNFIVKVLELRIRNKSKPEDALRTIYGVEIDADNANQCRSRLYDMAVQYGGNADIIEKIIENNIVTGDGLKAEEYWDDNGKLKTENEITYGKLSQFIEIH